MVIEWWRDGEFAVVGLRLIMIIMHQAGTDHDVHRAHARETGVEEAQIQIEQEQKKA